MKGICSMVGAMLPVLLASFSGCIEHTASQQQEPGFGLRHLLGPDVSESEFFASYWQKQPLHTAGSSGKPQKILSFAQLEALVSSPALDARMQNVVKILNAGAINEWWEPAVLEPLSVRGTDQAEKTLQQIGSLRRPGPPADFKSVHEAYLSGATVTVHAVELIWAAVDALCNGLRQEFELMFSAEVVAIGVAGTGLPPRAERQDLFILQLGGSADATIYHRPVRDGLPSSAASHQPGDLMQGFNGTNFWQGTVPAGGLLYLPRGWVYRSALSAGHPSLQLILTANTDSYSVGVFISHMLSQLEPPSPQLKKEIRKLYDEVVAGEELRAALPLRLHSDPEARTVARAAVQRGLELLKASVDKDTYYKVLGLSTSASLTEVKKAYRKLSMTNHPDKGGDPEKFKMISKAAEVLERLAGVRSSRAGGLFNRGCKNCARTIEELLTTDNFDVAFDRVVATTYAPAKAALGAAHAARVTRPINVADWYGISMEDKAKPADAAAKVWVRADGVLEEKGGDRTIKLPERCSAVATTLLGGTDHPKRGRKGTKKNKKPTAAVAVEDLPGADDFEKIAAVHLLSQLGVIDLVRHS